MNNNVRTFILHQKTSTDDVDIYDSAKLNEI